MNNDHPTVYSTEWGRVCPKCKRPIADCICLKKTVRPHGDGVVRVQRESKGRKGKTVTLISGIDLAEDPLKELLGDLKRMCGAGGASKDGIIEIQGDHRETIFEELKKRGFNVKKAGG